MIFWFSDFQWFNDFQQTLFHFDRTKKAGIKPRRNQDTKDFKLDRMYIDKDSPPNPFMTD